MNYCSSRLCSSCHKVQAAVSVAHAYFSRRGRGHRACSVELPVSRVCSVEWWNYAEWRIGNNLKRLWPNRDYCPGAFQENHENLNQYSHHNSGRYSNGCLPHRILGWQHHNNQLDTHKAILIIFTWDAILAAANRILISESLGFCTLSIFPNYESPETS
jgi:hypothetical protein